MSLPCGSQLSLEVVDDAYMHTIRSIGVHANRIKLVKFYACICVCEAPAVCKIKVRQMSN